MSTVGIRPQSLILTLYGDYIRQRGDYIRVGSLIKLLAVAGISEATVRTTISRMVHRGWLLNEKVGKASCYLFTPQARRVVEEGARRIFDFSSTEEKWDGCWHLVTFSIPEAQREGRDQLRRELGWLGYGMLGNGIWVSPRNRRAGVEQVADSLKVKAYIQTFSAQLEGFISAEQIVRRCWDLDTLNAEYAAFIEKYENLCREFELHPAEAIEDSRYFALRLMLIHEFRRFPYRDPQLPAELLPQHWCGREATALFRKYHTLLANRANKYFESVYA